MKDQELATLLRRVCNDEVTFTSAELKILQCHYRRSAYYALLAKIDERLCGLND